MPSTHAHRHSALQLLWWRLSDPIANAFNQMSRTERVVWTTPSTLHQYGTLMAEWLEGSIKSRPGYMPNCGPDPETADLVPVLASVNRAGFITENSQPGEGPVEHEGETWWQRAEVSGFCGDGALEDLRTMLAPYPGIHVVASKIRKRSFGQRWCYGHLHENVVPITGYSPWLRTDVPTLDTASTWSAVELTEADFDVMVYGVNDEMHAELRASWYVSVYDEKWGRNDVLWDALDEFAKLRQFKKRGYINADAPKVFVADEYLKLHRQFSQKHLFATQDEPAS